MSFLKVSGTAIVDGQGNEVVLRGAGLGGWMTMENFITGYPGCEFQIRDALAETIGKEKSEYFFDKFLEYFFAEDDAKFFKSLGLNCIRIAVSYRHFEDDTNPRVLKKDGFRHLDRAIEACAKHGIYTIIDMHTAPGGQNGGWHCDSACHIADFWRHKDFQDRFVWLWTEVARHYATNPWIAGYNLMNEPADPKGAGLIQVYDRLYAAIRPVDPHHIIFLDGNTYAIDFSAFPDNAKERWSNNAYAIHDYAIYGFPKTPEPYRRSPEQIQKLEDVYKRKRAWMDERGLCVWNGEWGPVYARREYDGDQTDDINEGRYNVLKDQLEIYHKDRLSWSIWLCKDIGYQGMVYVSKETPYMKRFEKFLARKFRLAVDAWGTNDQHVKHIYQPILELVEREIPEANKHLYPPIWSVENRVARLSRTMLVAEFMVQEWADTLKGLSEKELDEVAASFKFENCMKREGLNKALTDHASLY
ncbi:glycoside hydrolase family 5 protein [Coniophora puteana RWD-64-598 SS2]|uniref:Glycoside hydrolase family 5 protein n=1 Tax=Coniophora puteana (strain RWD-64-598) TaxID=741705 RepID=A0A5M3MEW0_CONPW|nr:glycoside hydrolase family 5 protein [Coniophora puteana RWD-64-598 SS2]EIW77768.1 glycoside hydrolase family 5 protein [Coniophora puteana RWD-64-598 SS2]